jgi:hypothetical protein
MQLFVQVISPLGTIGYVIDDPLVCNEFSAASLSCVAAKFHFGDDGIRNVHAGDYTGYWRIVEKTSCFGAGGFLAR